MKIIYVGDGGENYDLARFYLMPRRLYNGFVRNGHNVVLFSVKFMRKHLGWLPVRQFSIGRLNEKLLAFARNFRPDLVVLHHAHAVLPETLQALRRANPALRIAQVGFDALFIGDNVAKLQSKLLTVDATFVTTGGEFLRRFARNGSVAAFVPNPVDPSIDINRSFERTDQAHDLFLALTGAEGDTDRRDIPETLRRAIPDLRFAYYSHAAGQTIWGSDFVAALGDAKMGLNLSYLRKGDEPVPPEAVHMYSSSRIAHYAGNGLLLLLRRGHGLERLFAPDEAAFYDDPGELADQVRHYRDYEGERQAVAGRGWRRAHDSYSERHVAQFIVDVTTGAPFAKPYAWDTTVYR